MRWSNPISIVKVFFSISRFGREIRAQREILSRKSTFLHTQGHHVIDFRKKRIESNQSQTGSSPTAIKTTNIQ